MDYSINGIMNPKTAYLTYRGPGDWWDCHYDGDFDGVRFRGPYEDAFFYMTYLNTFGDV